MLTPNEFRELFPKCEKPEDFAEAVNKILPKYEITGPKRVASFLAQCAHESGGFRLFTENLNYSADALNRVFPKYFKNAGVNAQDYHRQPEKIANRVYANRMENGDESSGDGWRYRGRGVIQLTGKYNYTQFSKFVGERLCDLPDLIENIVEICLLTGVWFWDTNNLNSYADNWDIKGQTKRINGGYNGLDDRIEHFHKILTYIVGTLRSGDFGCEVIVIQELLNIKADGDFGAKTEKAVKDFQRKMGLVDDGIAGKTTIGALLSEGH
jgi:putative chitinase